ncbi:MAG: hypothetical protein KAG53_06100 [Endozoicomonadaceae bacterium]|nr:hypothetical protein [Endozoicomonadaceae bacterium]
MFWHKQPKDKNKIYRLHELESKVIVGVENHDEHDSKTLKAALASAD